MIIYSVISAYDIFYKEPEKTKAKQEKICTDPYFYLKGTVRDRQTENEKTAQNKGFA